MPQKCRKSAANTWKAIRISFPFLGFRYAFPFLLVRKGKAGKGWWGKFKGGKPGLEGSVCESRRRRKSVYPSQVVHFRSDSQDESRPRLQLAPALGRGLVSTTSDLGIFFDKTGSQAIAPHVLVQFLQKFKAATEFMVLFHLPSPLRAHCCARRSIPWTLGPASPASTLAGG
jgi:hypothetical protein